jgi:predicted small lipoprotein YifL
MSRTMNKIRTGWLGRALIVAIILAMASPLGACGRKGSPEFPEGTKYPRDYPKKN